MLQIGSRVKCLTHSWIESNKGRTGTVVDCVDNKYLVKFDDLISTFWFLETELELINK